MLKTHGPAVDAERPCIRRLRIDLQDFERLLPAAIRGAGLEPEVNHAPDNVLTGSLIALGSRAAPAVLVIG